MYRLPTASYTATRTRTLRDTLAKALRSISTWHGQLSLASFTEQEASISSKTGIRQVLSIL